MKRILVAAMVGVMVMANGSQVSAAGLKDVFDAKYYAEQYPDLQQAYGNNEKALYQHFMKYGIKEGRQMSPILDVVAYRNNNSDLNAAFGNDWDAYVKHYFKYGVYENRDNGTDFDVLKYVESYKDVKDAFGNDLAKAAKHYKDHGREEGRNEGKKPGHGINKPGNGHGGPAANKPGHGGPGVNKPGQGSDNNKPGSEDTSGSIVSTDTTTFSDGSYYVSEYNALGQMVKRTFYYADGTVERYFTAEFNSEGLETGCKYYDANGVLTGYDVNEYDENNDRIRATIYNVDGSWTVNEYDRVNHKHTVISYDADGNRIGKDVYHLDETGAYLGYTVYNLDDTVNGVYVLVHDADGNGTGIPVEGDIDWSRLSVTVVEDGSVYVSQCDENGLEIEYSYYDANLEFVLKVVNTYNDEFACVGSIVYEANGNYCVNTYDHVNNQHIWEAFGPDGSFVDKGIYDKDENGNYIRYTEYNEDGSVRQVYNCVTDEYGNITMVPVE